MVKIKSFKGRKNFNFFSWYITIINHDLLIVHINVIYINDILWYVGKIYQFSIPQYKEAIYHERLSIMWTMEKCETGEPPKFMIHTQRFLRSLRDFGRYRHQHRPKCADTDRHRTGRDRQKIARDEFY